MVFFDSDTLDALQEFQTLLGLRTSGLLDDETKHKLNSFNNSWLFPYGVKSVDSLIRLSRTHNPITFQGNYPEVISDESPLNMMIYGNLDKELCSYASEAGCNVPGSYNAANIYTLTNNKSDKSRYMSLIIRNPDPDTPLSLNIHSLTHSTSEEASYEDSAGPGDRVSTDFMRSVIRTENINNQSVVHGGETRLEVPPGQSLVLYSAELNYGEFAMRGLISSSDTLQNFQLAYVSSENKIADGRVEAFLHDIEPAHINENFDKYAREDYFEGRVSAVNQDPVIKSIKQKLSPGGRYITWLNKQDKDKIHSPANGSASFDFGDYGEIPLRELHLSSNVSNLQLKLYAPWNSQLDPDLRHGLDPYQTVLRETFFISVSDSKGYIKEVIEVPAHLRIGREFLLADLDINKYKSSENEQIKVSVMSSNAQNIFPYIPQLHAIAS